MQARKTGYDESKVGILTLQECQQLIDSTKVLLNLEFDIDQIMTSRIEALRAEALVYQMERYDKEHQHPLGLPKTNVEASEKSNST
jgi:hypothetical protein